MKVIQEVVNREVYTKKIAKDCLMGPESARVWVDLGMHIGCFSSYAVSAGCVVYGFEAEETNYRLACVNVPLNLEYGGAFKGFHKAVVPKAMMNETKRRRLRYFMLQQPPIGLGIRCFQGIGKNILGSPQW